MSVSVQRTAATSSNPRRRDRLSLNQKSQGAHDLHHVQSDLKGTSRIVLGGGLTAMNNTVAFVVATGESLPEIPGFSKERSSADSAPAKENSLPEPAFVSGSLGVEQEQIGDLRFAARSE